MILTGEMISAADAQRIGLVNEVVAPADLLKRAEEIAGKIIANGPVAARLCLEAVNKGLEMPVAEGLAHEASLFGLAFATKDKTEGTKAFMEKRAPQFKGE
jgi:enoyl-CoA hydratase/carnithine racemase